MQTFSVRKIVFSSSATVYGTPTSMPLYESDSIGGTTNPYGTSKYINELLLMDACAAIHGLTAVTLRYFNPIGAHPSGLMGEDPRGIPNNLMPYMTQVAVGKRDELSIFGNDYPTRDGTGVRDYIHVVDLALGHVAAIENKQAQGFVVYNLGTGKGTSVLELVHAFHQATGVHIPYVFKARRPGDIAENYANCEKAKKELNWVATRSIKTACEDAWRWQMNNPEGYKNT